MRLDIWTALHFESSVTLGGELDRQRQADSPNMNQTSPATINNKPGKTTQQTGEQHFAKEHAKPQRATPKSESKGNHDRDFQTKVNANPEVRFLMHEQPSKATLTKPGASYPIAECNGQSDGAPGGNPKKNNILKRSSRTLTQQIC